MRILLAICLASCTCVAQSVQEPFVLTISVPSSTVKAGKPVWVAIAMKNISNHEVDCTAWDVNGMDLRFNYDVRNEAGSSVKDWSQHPEAMAGSIRLCRLKPGESMTGLDSLISGPYQLDNPGKYTIQVSRGAGETEQDGFVKSNTITVTVTP